MKKIFACLTPLLFLVAILVIYRYQVWAFLRSGNQEDYRIVQQYLTLIISWPFVVAVLGLLFMQKFSESIAEFITKMRNLKGFGVEAQVGDQQRENESAKGVQQQIEIAEKQDEEQDVNLTAEQVNEIAAAFQGKDEEIQNLKNLALAAINRAELFEFGYLNLLLVPNSKVALMVLGKQPVPKSIFLSEFQVSDQVTDSVQERHAIMTALIGNGLIEDDGTILKITAKGQKFLDSARLSSS